MKSECLDSQCISVIIPVFNVEKYLEACMDSVLQQTWNNYEVILVDDGSTDSSGDLCDRYCREHDIIRVIHQKNQGLSAARNTGIKYARGSYICFIDSDDVIHNMYLEILYNNLDMYGADISICRYKEFQLEGQIDSKIEMKNQVVEMTKIDLMKKLSKLDVHIENISVISAWNKLYRITLFDNCMYQEGKLHEDELIIHHLIQRASKIVMTDAVLYYYRMRPNSIMDRKKRNKKEHLSIVDAFEERTDLCKQHYPEIYPNMLKGYLDTLCIWIFRMLKEREMELAYALQKQLGTVLDESDFQSMRSYWYRCVLRFPKVSSLLWERKMWIQIKIKNLKNAL